MISRLLVSMAQHVVSMAQHCHCAEATGLWATDGAVRPILGLISGQDGLRLTMKVVEDLRMARRAVSSKTQDDVIQDEEVDGCLCEVEIPDAKVTSDVDLPVAAGGVEMVRLEDAGGEEVDGCEADFNKRNPTTDEELPAAIGGVA